MTQTAHPPIVAVAFITVVLSICSTYIPAIFSSLDSIATVEVLTTPRFEDLISKTALGYIRLLIASLIFSVSIQKITNKQKRQFTTPYLEGSKLRRLPITFYGTRSQSMFTAWSWNLLGIAFALNGMATLLIAYNYNDSEIPVPAYLQNLMRCALLTFEISAPTSMIVSSITRYVLWPQALKNGDTLGFRKISALLQHNANVIISLIEVGILGRIPMRIDYIPLAAVYGIVYILHTWNMTHRWLPSKDPQFVYFFFDTTLDKKVVVFVLAALLFIMTLFHCMFFSVVALINHFDGGVLLNTFLVAGVASCFCRFRD